MKLGVFTPVIADMSLEEALKYLHGLGVDSVELGAGGYPGTAHLNPEKIISDKNESKRILGLLEENEMDICAISCHGNPLHPNKELANKFHNEFKNAILVAKELNVDTIVGFSGCPGDCDESKYPNWVVTPWPYFSELLKWQWEEKVIPYWKEMAKFAKDNGIKKIAFEMHPGFVVYNSETLLKLRNEVGDIIGANVDPSHLIWQQMDPCAVIKKLKGAIYHFHAKDTFIDEQNKAVNGVLDTKTFHNYADDSWDFRTVGYGNGKKYWNDIISTLKKVGYNGVISIEHEDALMSPKEGLEKAVSFLKDSIIYEQPVDAWWL